MDVGTDVKVAAEVVESRATFSDVQAVRKLGLKIDMYNHQHWGITL